MMRVAVIGCAGRMGRTLVREVAATEGLELAAATEFASSDALGQDAGILAGIAPLGVAVDADLERVLEQVDAAIDFTTPDSTAAVAQIAARQGVRLVIGTTGLGSVQRDQLRQAAEQTPIVFAANMSVGINVMLRLVADAARLLGADYALEIVEAHHRHKKDAPSGTALLLAEALAEATAEQGTLAERACYGRHGVAVRSPAEIGIHTVRGGDIVGEHTVLLCGDGERIELTHRASSRQTFSRGAVRAVSWLAGRAPGLYDMQDVLGLR